MITIRRARVKDAEMLARLEEELMGTQMPILLRHCPRHAEDFARRKHARTMFEGYVRRCVHSARSLVLLAEVEKEPAGYLMLSLKKNIPIYALEELGLITDIFVRKPFRRQGIATGLKDEAMRWLAARGITRVSLHALPDNAQAIRLYRAWGFTPFFLEMRADVPSRSDAIIAPA